MYEREAITLAQLAGPILCSSFPSFSVLFHPTQLPLLLGSGLRLDLLFRSSLPDAGHSVRPTLPVQTLLKQFLGFEDPQNRVSHATQRTAPLIFYIYDLVVIWYAQSGYRLAPHSTLQRFWYKQKNLTFFEDLLRTLGWSTGQERIFAESALDRTTPMRRQTGRRRLCGDDHKGLSSLMIGATPPRFMRSARRRRSLKRDHGTMLSFS